jgi:putative phosphoesterase
MKILVISDSHGYIGKMQEVYETEEPDVLFHLGDSELQFDWLRSFFDIPIYCVRGNCDVDDTFKPKLIAEVMGHRFFLTHGHRFGVKSDIEHLAYVAKEENCDVALYGHTHLPFFKEINGVTVANPGSLELPRQADRRKSYMVITEAADGKLKFEQKYL